MKTSFPQHIRQYVIDRQEIKIQELNHRRAEAEDERDAYRYESYLIEGLIKASTSPKEIDRWEFEGQIIQMNIQQAEFDLERLEEELDREMMLYECTVDDMEGVSYCS